ncbi:DUF1385 domain-containing protein [Candidatus Woesearchaeota archaeon]|nr:DUF1385 domain-containing protein [Candidatus Woesearchaeota archaeon]
MKQEIGGQAVIEGVMMRSPTDLTIAVRKEDNSIVTKKERIRRLKKPFRAPFIRGIVSLVDTVVIGIKALTWSANQATDHDEELRGRDIFFIIAVSFAFAIAFFIVLPLYLTKLVTQDQGIIFNLIDGVIRIGVFLIYILAISLMKDVKRIFQYHGAEHKAVNCYEDNKALTVKNVKKYSTLHPRCGTAFLVIVLVISILVFSVITSPSFWVKLISRIILIPVVAGISFEFLKLAGRYRHNPIIKILNAPGMGIQKITTKEPDDKQIEVAIKSLKLALS